MGRRVAKEAKVTLAVEAIATEEGTGRANEDPMNRSAAPCTGAELPRGGEGACARAAKTTPGSTENREG